MRVYVSAQLQLTITVLVIFIGLWYIYVSGLIVLIMYHLCNTLYNLYSRYNFTSIVV